MKNTKLIKLVASEEYMYGIRETEQERRTRESSSNNNCNKANNKKIY